MPTASNAPLTSVVVPAFNEGRMIAPLIVELKAATIATQSHVTNSSVLLILLSVLIFLIGLVSEQIAALRFEGPRR